MRFVILFVGFSALVASGIAGFNYIVDPYGVWNSGFFAPTQYRGIPIRTYHPVRVMTGDYDYVFLGSSRTREGYLPQKENMDIASYNAAFSGGTAYEAAVFMSLMAQKTTPPHHVILGVDFFSFAPGLKLRASALDSPLNDVPLWQVKLSTLFGHKHLKAGLKSLKKNLRGKVKPLPSEFPGYIFGNHKERMKAGLKSHAEDHMTLFDPNHPTTDGEIIDALSQGITALTSKGTTVTLIINPIHASRMRLIDKMGLAENYETLIRELINIVNQNPSGLVEFWDFAACKSVVLESVPDDSAVAMTYFYDSNHFTPEFGNDIAKQTFLRDQYPDYIPIYEAIKLAPSSLQDFSRNWGECNSNIDDILDDILKNVATSN